jgi:tRNA (cytidine/uridine-2'-O-)-methyltransferase
MNIILLEPEIPYNTGNIGRTCVATDTSLHLIKPLGFSIDEKSVKRSGLDYWQDVDLHVYENFEDFMKKNNYPTVYMGTTKAKQTYAEVSFAPDAFIMFGKETAGIPEELLLEHKETAIRIPMAEGTRSLNLSNSVAIVLYEALRQNNFMDLENEGQLHRYKW